MIEKMKKKLIHEINECQGRLLDQHKKKISDFDNIVVVGFLLCLELYEIFVIFGNGKFFLICHATETTSDKTK